MTDVSIPWEKFGTTIPANERNILKRAKLDWMVSKNPAHALVADRSVPIPGVFALVREPDFFLKCCGDRFTPTQNAELLPFWKTLLSYSKFSIDVAGSSFKSQWVWVLSKTKYGFSLGTGKDFVDAYILLAHPHYCGETMRPLLLLVRHANQSTYVERVKWGNGSEHFKCIPPDQWSGENVAKARGLVANVKKTLESVEIRMAKLARVPIKEDTAKQYFTKIMFSDREAGKMRGTPNSTLQMFDIMRRGHGSELLTSVNTWWGAFQAASYYLDRIAGVNEDSRFFSSWFGPRADQKRKALDIAYNQVKDL